MATTKELLDTERFTSIAALYRWGTNFESKNSPFTLFIDLIGVSEDEFGENLFFPTHALSYTELGLLGEALSQYADIGQDAHNYATELALSTDED